MLFQDPREAIEQTLLSKLQALTPADGVPQSFSFVTRSLVHLADLKETQLPACFLQFEEPELYPKLSHVYDVELPGRIVVAFAPSFNLSASEANAYRLALERLLTQDTRLGGRCDLVMLRGTLMPGLWQEIGLFGLGVLFRILYEVNPAQPAMTL